MNTDRVLAIVSIILGVPAFLSLFIQSAHRREAVLCIVISGLIIGFRQFLTYRNNKPQFDVTRVRKHFVILSADGTSAHFEGTRSMKSNFKGATEFWHRNIIQDGTITNIKIDGKTPDATEIICGTTHVCKRFARPLAEDEQIETTLSYDLVNSFCNPKRESVIHNNPYQTDEVEIIVDLPRACTRAELRQTFIGEEGKILPPPKLSNNNLRIVANVKKPQIGASYHVEWDW